jgi:hypothetical protein
MHRIEIALVTILLLPLIVTGAALLMGWPVQDRLFYLSIGWVLGWLACYLTARGVGWVIARWAGYDPKSN